MTVQCFKGQRLCHGNDILSIFPEQKNQVLKIELELFEPQNQDVELEGITFYAKTIDGKFI